MSNNNFSNHTIPPSFDFSPEDITSGRASAYVRQIVSHHTVTKILENGTYITSTPLIVGIFGSGATPEKASIAFLKAIEETLCGPLGNLDFKIPTINNN
jgi:hypothetical protein